MGVLKSRIEAGLRGDFKGLRNGFKRINTYIFGVQRRCITLIGGMSGTYKTTLVDYVITNAIDDAEAQGININIFYYSFEIDELTKKCNWLSTIIFQKYGIAIAPEKIKGLGDFRLTPDEKELVDSEIPAVDALFNKIKFRYKPINPTGIYNELWQFAAGNGKFQYEEYVDKEGNIKKKIVGYTPNDPNSYNLVVVDHQGLLLKERGFTNKEVIDKYSEYCVELRNQFGFSFFNINQFNDGLSSVDRAKFKGVDLSPQMTDFKDTRNPYADADIVLGTMCPHKLDMESCLGYDITKLKSNMIMLKIIKNRLSTDNIAIGLHVNPKAGSFSELPPVKEINYEHFK